MPTINGHTPMEETALQRRSIRSRAISEVISVKPGFIISWGMYVMLIVFIAAFILSAFVQFPDTVVVDLQLEHTGSNQYLAKGTIAEKNAGVIQPGQLAVARQETSGHTIMLQGAVQSVNKSSADSGYRVNIMLTAAQDNKWAVGETARATISTGEHSLLSRLFGNRLTIFKK
ncbi:MAG: hypothetical protein QM687_10785 [Ferruginibacter sp.]